MRLVFVALFFFTSVAIGHTQNANRQFFITQPNADTCTKILTLEPYRSSFRLSADDVHKAMEYKLVAGWFIGYLSAVNAFHPQSDGRIAAGMTGQDFMAWAFSYCRANPASTFVDLFNAFNKAFKIPTAW